MAINFPHNPNVNDVHTESSLGKSWKWDGTTWLIYSSSTTGIGYADLSVTTEAAQGGGSLTYNNTNGQFTFKPAAGSGGGATNFTGLGDTPSSLLAGKWLKVNTGGTALEWTDAPTGNDTNDYVSSASLSGNTLTLGRTGSQSLADLTVDLSSLNSVPTNITVANESTDTECYPLFTTEATGNLAPKTVTSFKLNSASGQLEAGSFKKTGGSSAEFLKADGSVDSTTYLSSNPSYALNDLSNVDAVTGAANGKILKYNGTSWEVADDLTGGGSGSPEIVWTLTANGSSDYIFSGDGFPTGTTDPDITLIRGQTYKFTNNTGGHPFRIQTNPAQSGGGTQYNSGVTNNDASGASNQTLIFVVPMDAPSTLYYQCTAHPAMTGTINILDASVPSLNDLSNVDATTNLANGKILKYDLGSTTWVVADDNASGGGSANFTGLSDTPSAHSNNKWLKSDGSALIWTDAPSSYSDSDVDTHLNQSNPTSGHVLSWNGSDYAWVAQTSTYTLPVASSTVRGGIKLGSGLSITNTDVLNVSLALAGLNDVTVSGSVTTDHVLTWNGSAWVPQAAQSGSTPDLAAVLGAGNTSTLAATVGNFTCDNLTVNGTTTTVNSNTVNIGDSNLTLNSDETGTPSQNGGITIERGTSDNVSLRWNETTDKWQYTNDGTNYSDIGSSTLPVASSTVRGGIKLGTGLSITNTDVLNVSIGIGSLNDVTLSGSTTTNHVLTWNGSAWVPQAAQDTNTQLSTEQVQDIVGAMFSGNTETRISATYQDSDGTIDLVVDDMNDSLTDTNTTYSISCVDGANSDEERIRLTAGGSGSGTDDIVLEAGTGLSIARSGDKITFTNTETSSYSLPVASATVRGGVKLGTGLNITGTDVLNVALAIGGLADVTVSGSPSSGQVITWDGSAWTNGAAPGVPAGTIVMYNGDSAPAGWALCDGGGGRPDLRDKFVVGSGSSYNRGSTGGAANVTLSTSQMPSHTHGDGNYGTSTHNGHTHGDGNYAAAAGGSHTHQANVSGNTGNQSANHYHTIGGNKPDGSPGTWTANTSGGNHGHSYRVSNGHPQSNMTGIARTGGDDDNSTNNTDILSSGGGHNHTVNLTGVTTGGIDQNHTHSMNFNINTSPPLTSSNHTHNVSGNSGSGGNHSHNVSGNSGSQGSGNAHENRPPYYAITFIIKL